MTNVHNHISTICCIRAQAFDHPRNVVTDADLTLNEKRAILASWASDACAVEAAPALRHAPGGRRPVSVDEILEALQALDRGAKDGAMRTQRQLRRCGFETFRSRRRGGVGPGSGLTH